MNRETNDAFMRGETSPCKGVVLTFCKSLIPQENETEKKDFIIWGPFDFLYINSIKSLSQIHSVNGGKDSTDLGLLETGEKRHLYLYKDNETGAPENGEIKQIFRYISKNPLLVITLIKAKEFSQIKEIVEREACENLFELDLFKTLGNDSGVVVSRAQTYHQIIGCLVNLNKMCENTYSIGGVQNYPLGELPQDTNTPIFSAAMPTGDSILPPTSFVSINYLLKDKGKKKHIVETAEKILALKDKILRDFKLSKEEIKLTCYYVIGYYDIEIRLEGQIVYLLEFLMNTKYGLANVNSDFYKKFVSTSRTTWKTLV